MKQKCLLLIAQNKEFWGFYHINLISSFYVCILHWVNVGIIRLVNYFGGKFDMFFCSSLFLSLSVVQLRTNMKRACIFLTYSSVEINSWEFRFASLLWSRMLEHKHTSMLTQSHISRRAPTIFWKLASSNIFSLTLSLFQCDDNNLINWNLCAFI